VDVIERANLVLDQIEDLAAMGNPKAQEMVQLSRATVSTQDPALREALNERICALIQELNDDLGHEWRLKAC
jgi:hypothetical protein